MASGTAAGVAMIGLEDRLKQVDGVSSIRVELGENGVDSIKVEVHDGVEETSVLEEIRRVLVAYGWRSRRPAWLQHGDAGQTVDLTLPRFARMEELVAAAEPSPPTVSMRHEGSNMVVVLERDDRRVEATGSVSPIGAAQAMMKAMADWLGVERPDRVAVVMHEMDGEKVVTLMVRRGDQTVLAAEVATPLLHDALFRATNRALRELGE